MRKTEEARCHRVGWIMIVAVGVCAVIGLADGVASAGDAVEETQIRPGTTLVDGAAVSAGDVREETEITYGAMESPEVATACDTYPSREPEVPALWKLGRGFHNLVFGFPAEVVRNPVIEILKADTVFGVGAGAMEGILVGVGKGFWRVGAGFLDIVTFPASIAPWYDCEHLPKYPF